MPRMGAVWIVLASAEIITASAAAWAQGPASNAATGAAAQAASTSGKPAPANLVRHAAKSRAHAGHAPAKTPNASN